MAESIVKDKRRVLPCAAYLKGEFGYEGIFLGVPCVLGANGLEKIIEVDLTEDEAEALGNSVGAVQHTMSSLESIQ
jgi:malate dehydrogenase